MGKFGNSERMKSLSDIAGEQEQEKLTNELLSIQKELIATDKEILRLYKIRMSYQIKISEIEIKLGEG